MDDLEQLRFDRHFRTASSEGYHIMRAGERVATADLHFTLADVRCTLILEKPMKRDEIARLIERIDEDLVLSADVPREDLLVNVYQGSEVGFFSDEFHADQDELVSVEDEEDDDTFDDDELGRN
ncbi:MAG TPA: hypothetical protein VE338_03945 [Ktedonobacterales bacterium]|jgi:hypothetical protein|nr:hypothetical protein [Ktedonobacterales bacterium]